MAKKRDMQFVMKRPEDAWYVWPTSSDGEVSTYLRSETRHDVHAPNWWKYNLRKGQISYVRDLILRVISGWQHIDITRTGWQRIDENNIPKKWRSSIFENPLLQSISVNGIVYLRIRSALSRGQRIYQKRGKCGARPLRCCTVSCCRVLVNSVCPWSNLSSTDKHIIALISPVSQHVWASWLGSLFWSIQSCRGEFVRGSSWRLWSSKSPNLVQDPR